MSAFLTYLETSETGINSAFLIDSIMSIERKKERIPENFPSSYRVVCVLKRIGATVWCKGMYSESACTFLHMRSHTLNGTKRLQGKTRPHLWLPWLSERPSDEALSWWIGLELVSGALILEDLLLVPIQGWSIIEIETADTQQFVDWWLPQRFYTVFTLPIQLRG